MSSIAKNLTVNSDDKWGFDESDSEEIYSHTEEKSHDKIINKCDFGQRHLIGACISSTTTLFQSGESGELSTLFDTSDSDGKNDNNSKQHKIQTYPTMLKLISGSLVGSANYNEIYLDLDDEDAFNSRSTNDSDTRKQEEDTKNVPPSEDEFKNICFYDLTICYKKTIKSYNTTQVNSDEGSHYKVRGVRRYKFNQSHPWYEFSYLTELKQPTIPRIALPKDKRCALNKLQLNAKNPIEDSIDKREMYAKMALLMFYPFRQLTDLTCKKLLEKNSSGTHKT